MKNQAQNDYSKLVGNMKLGEMVNFVLETMLIKSNLYCGNFCLVKDILGYSQNRLVKVIKLRRSFKGYQQIIEFAAESAIFETNTNALCPVQRCIFKGDVQRMGVVQNVFEGWEKCLMLWKPIYFLDQQDDWEMTSYVVYKHQGGNK